MDLIIICDNDDNELEWTEYIMFMITTSHHLTRQPVLLVFYSYVVK